MQARVVSWNRGAGWLAEGWRLFRAAPFGWLALIVTYWMLMTMLSLLPVAGVAIVTVLVPGFSVGFMAASRAAEQRRAVELGMLFQGLRSNPVPQLTLGVVYLVLLVLLLAATAIADGGALARWMLTGARPPDDVIGGDAFFVALMMALALYAPVMMMFWFAPLLAAWHSVAPPKALFFSIVACLLNWRAFVAYGIAVALMTVVLPFLILSVLLLAAGGSAGAPAVSLLPVILVVLPVMFASFYASYRDVFGDAPAPGEDTE